MHRPPREMAELRVKQWIQAKPSNYNCYGYNQQCFAYKLPYQRKAHGANHLSYPDFFCTFYRTCRCKVHEVDTCNQQNKNSDNAKEFYILNSSARNISLLIKIGMQVNIAIIFHA